MRKNIANTIRSQIQNGTLSMRSSASVWAEKLGLGSGLILLLLFLIFLTGSILYWNSTNSEFLYPGYGAFGVRSYFASFPYLLVILFVVLFTLGSYILRRYDFSYKQPFLLILSLVVGIILLLGWVSVHTPGGRQIYKQQGRRMHLGRQQNATIITGRVIKINTVSILIQQDSGQLIKVSISPSTHFPFGIPKIQSEVRIVGIMQNNIYQAVGVRTIPQ